MRVEAEVCGATCADPRVRVLWRNVGGWQRKLPCNGVSLRFYKTASFIVSADDCSLAKLAPPHSDWLWSHRPGSALRGVGF